MCSQAETSRFVSWNGSGSSKKSGSRAPRPYSPADSRSQKSRSFEVPRSKRWQSGPVPYGTKPSGTSGWSLIE